MKAFLFITILAATVTAAAQDAEKSDKSDKLDIQKLEKKYWAAKDDEQSVVQNRAFSKEKRYYIFSSYGVPINDPYNAGQIYNTAVGYYFSEKWGTELSYLSSFMTNNDATDQFITEHQTVPNHNRLKQAVNLNVMFVPFYAKMSFLDVKIVYFDMGVSLGLGTSTYEMVTDQGDKIEQSGNFSLSVFQHYFFTKHFAMRADFKNTWTKESKERYRVQGGGGRSLGVSTVNDTSLIVGVTLWF